jgi:hypothetical protein
MKRHTDLLDNIIFRLCLLLRTYVFYKEFALSSLDCQQYDGISNLIAHTTWS